MSFKVMCLLILLNSLQTNARGRIPIPKNLNASSTEHLDLPHGFDPQSPPTNPLLYPFVTEQPASNVSSTTSGWRPVVTESAMIQTTAQLRAPLLQDRISRAPELQQEVSPRRTSPGPGPVLESIVYGAWKLEPPLQPNLTLKKSDKADDENFAVSLEKVMRGKIGGFIEEIGSRKPIADSTDFSRSNDPNENLSASKTQFIEKLGRRKIKSQDNQNPTKTATNQSMEVEKVDTTDPALLSIFKQINESVESHNKPKKYDETSVETHSNSSKQISKEWPTDFLGSPESGQIQENSMQDHVLNFSDDSSELSQQIPNNLYSAETKPQTPAINITKMGVPFESQNSDEGPSICVPLAVREPSVSNPMEIVEIERVYCFPLPMQEVQPQIESTNENLTFDKNAQFNNLSYEELMVSSVKCVQKNAVWLFSLSFLVIIQNC